MVPAVMDDTAQAKVNWKNQNAKGTSLLLDMKKSEHLKMKSEVTVSS